MKPKEEFLSTPLILCLEDELSKQGYALLGTTDLSNFTATLALNDWQNFVFVCTVDRVYARSFILMFINCKHPEILIQWKDRNESDRLNVVFQADAQVGLENLNKRMYIAQCTHWIKISEYNTKGQAVKMKCYACVGRRCRDVRSRPSNLKRWLVFWIKHFLYLVVSLIFIPIGITVSPRCVMWTGVYKFD